MNRIKWIVPSVMAVFLMAVLVPAAYAGVSWSGIDPIFKANGHRFNVWVEWPEGYTCSIEEPIQVVVRVPEEVSYAFVSESSDDVGNCGEPQVTTTTVKFRDRDDVQVITRVASEETFPVRVKVYLDGELVRTYEGDSDGKVTGEPIPLPDDDDDDDD